MRVLALRFFSPAEIKEIKERCWRSVRYERISFISAGLKSFCGSRAMQPCATLQPTKQVAKPLPQRVSATLQPICKNSCIRARETPLAQANYSHYSNFCQSLYANFFQPYSTKDFSRFSCECQKYFVSLQQLIRQSIYHRHHY